MMGDKRLDAAGEWERGVVVPSPYQVALMEHFRRKAEVAKEQALTEVKNLLVGAGVIAALIWLLSQTKQ